MPQTGKTRIATPQTRSPTEQTRPACPLHPHATAQPSNIVRAASTPPQPPARARRRGPIHPHPVRLGAATRRKASRLRATDGSVGASSVKHAAPCRAAPAAPEAAIGISARRREASEAPRAATPRAGSGTALMMRRRRNPWRRRTSVVPPPAHAGRERGPCRSTQSRSTAPYGR
jgi:hypothetical protein